MNKFNGIVLIAAIAVLLIPTTTVDAQTRYEVERSGIGWATGAIGFQWNFWPELSGTAIVDEAAILAVASNNGAIWSSEKERNLEGNTLVPGSPDGDYNVFITMPFNGTGVDVLYAQHSEGATMEVFVDGVSAGVVDTLGAASIQTFSAAAQGSLTNGLHVVKIANGGGAYVVIDAIDVYDEVALDYAEAEDASLVTTTVLSGTAADIFVGLPFATAMTHGDNSVEILGGNDTNVSWSTSFDGTDIGILIETGWVFHVEGTLGWSIDGGASTGRIDVVRNETILPWDGAELGLRMSYLLATGLSPGIHTIEIETLTPDGDGAVIRAGFDAFVTSGSFDVVDVKDWELY